MRITSLSFENVLSFGTKPVELQLDPELTVIVGPNGAGKTNAVRLVDLVVTALDWSDRASLSPALINAASVEMQSYAAARFHGSNQGSRQVVRIGVELTSDEEQDIIVTYMQAAVYSTMLYEIRPADQAAWTAIASWVTRSVVRENLTDLCRGTIVIEHDGRRNRDWEVGYEFEIDESRSFRWILNTPMPPIGIAEIASETGQTSQVRSQERLTDRLVNGATNDSSESVWYSKLSDFNLEDLCPANADGIVDLQVQAMADSFPLAQLPARRFADLVGMPNPSQRSYTFAWVLRQILGRSLAFTTEQYRGVGTFSTAPRPANTYSWEDLAAPAPRWEPHALPLRLFRLKNGTAAGRHRFNSIRQTFNQLTNGLSFDIRFDVRESPVPASAITSSSSNSEVAQQLAAAPVSGSTRMTSPNITVVVSSETSAHENVLDWELPIQLSGAGTWEALVIAEAVTNASDRVIFLDEPASNLHPTWQNVLRDHVLNAPGQFVLITHSPNLIPVEKIIDQPRIIRLRPTQAGTRVTDLRDNDIEQGWRNRWRQILSGSVEAISALFVRGVILVEGDTDRAAFGLWFKSSQIVGSDRRRIDVRNILLLPVDSDKSFGAYVTYLRSFAIPWAILCDGPVLSPDREVSLFQQLNESQVGLSEQPNTGLFEDWKAFWEQNGVFTVADAFGGIRDNKDKSGEIEAFFNRVDCNLWSELVEKHNSKVRAAYAFVETADMEAHPARRNELIRIWNAIVDRIDE